MSVARARLILNVGCGGRPGDQRANYGDVRIDIEKFPNVTDIIDAHELPESWTGRFYEVVCETALEHFDSPIKALSEMTRVLSPDGRIIIVVPNLHFWRRLRRGLRPAYDELRTADNPPDHKQGWDLVEMRNLAVQCGLVILSQEFLDWLPEKKRAPRPLIGKLFVWLLPPCFKRTEVRFTMLKEVRT